jgi:DNA-binding GntR family transcriptional regulator
MSRNDNRDRLADSVYRELQARLISLTISPGERITIDGLARDLDVSQSPIREALALLENDGLVMKTHLVGYRATPRLDREQFEDLFEMRLLIEPHAAGRAAKFRSAGHVEALRETNRRMVAETDLGGRLSYGTFARLDAELHDIVAEASGNALLREQLAKLHSHLHLFRLHHDTSAPQVAVVEHALVIEAVASGEVRRAQRAMREHLEKSRQRFRAVFGRSASH